MRTWRLLFAGPFYCTVPVRYRLELLWENGLRDRAAARAYPYRLAGAELTAAELRAALPRGGADVEAVLPTVRPIVAAVAERGAEAALDFGASFDGVRPHAIRVPDAALDAALAGLDCDVCEALQVMVERTRAVHLGSVAPTSQPHWARARRSPSGGFRSSG